MDDNAISVPDRNESDTSPRPVPTERNGRKPRATSIFSVSILGLWISMILYGVVTLLIYDAKPGEAASAPRTLPKSNVDPRNDMPLMLVFLHPHCPCSRNTVEQLQYLLLESQGALECRVHFVIPPDTERGWESGDLLRRVRLIPGLTVEYDRGGIQAQHFAATTSGQVLFYKRDRTLAFSGGITPSRGHAGDCMGSQAISKLLENEDWPYRQAPIYGCQLLNSERICGENWQCQQ